jgi:glycosyltransferase involved in cell wall biosynthesis
MLAYYFPPLGGAGVQRTLKHVKYLRRHGWVATVVTGRPGSYPVDDRSLLADVPEGTRVVRARNLPLASYAGMVLRRLGLRSLAGLVIWPDGGLGWAPALLWRAWREVRRNPPDAIYSTSSPYSAHLVARLLARRTGIPWVADFRDEWAHDVHQREAPPLARWLSHRAEKAVMSDASEVVVVADYFELDGIKPGTRTTITNGVDPDDLAGLPVAPPQRRDRMRLSFVGTLYAERDCAPVLEALGRLVEDGRLPADAVEFRVIGNVWLPGAERILPANTVHTGYVDHNRALEEMREADVLLLYVPPASLAPSGKLYEYLASERPILCVARRDNLAFQLVDEWGAGAAAEPGDGAAIEAALLDLYERWREGGLPDVAGVRERTLEHYGRPRLAEQLAGVLDRAAGAA